MPYICPWCGSAAPYLRGEQPCDCSRRVAGRKDWPQTESAGRELARLDVIEKRLAIEEGE